jgi:hypothetical protein
VVGGAIGMRDGFEKVWRQDGMVLATAGGARPGAVVRFCARFGSPPVRGLDAWMQTAFPAAVRKAYADEGVDVKDADTGFIVGIRGALFHIDANLYATRVADGIIADGSGGDVALGSLASTYGAPRRRLTTALEVSERYCEGVRRPWTILNTRPK